MEWSNKHEQVSTHASLAGRDPSATRRASISAGFYPRVPCGTRHAAIMLRVGRLEFLPTRPLRDATMIERRIYYIAISFYPRVPCGTRHSSFSSNIVARSFYPRVPCGTRQGLTPENIKAGVVSTHASLAGRDPPPSAISPIWKSFLPTRPLRDATIVSILLRQPRMVSTHASLAGRDQATLGATRNARCFYPRVPCGTRHTDCVLWPPESTFLPTRPLRDATHRLRFMAAGIDVSTHASLAGRDQMAADIDAVFFVSTHASLAGRDGSQHRRVLRRRSFYPRVPCGTRHRRHSDGARRRCFYPRVPCGTRRYARVSKPIKKRFLPTRPLRDATPAAGAGDDAGRVSTHASLAGRDFARVHFAREHHRFLPTRPLRDAT